MSKVIVIGKFSMHLIIAPSRLKTTMAQAKHLPLTRKSSPSRSARLGLSPYRLTPLTPLTPLRYARSASLCVAARTLIHTTRGAAGPGQPWPGRYRLQALRQKGDVRPDTLRPVAAHRCYTPSASCRLLHDHLLLPPPPSQFPIHEPPACQRAFLTTYPRPRLLCHATH